MRDNSANIRNAGDVLRYHTRKVLHRQDVANHSWNVARIYVDMFGIPRAEVLVYIMYHDVPEVITGDVPFQIKRIMPELKAELATAESYAIGKLGYNEMMLTPEELRNVKIADLMEMREYAMSEIDHGNSMAWDIVENIKTALDQMEYR